MDTATSELGKPLGLVRGLGLWAATAIVIGSMIGQAVFLVASDMSREVGSMWKVLAVWIVGGVVVLFGAFCYAELGAALPEAGGDYIYLSRGIGPLWGFLFGWTSFHDYEARFGRNYRCWAPAFRGVSCTLRNRHDLRLEPKHSIPVAPLPVYIQ